MIEFGLEESATVELNRQLSPTLRNRACSEGSDEFLEVCYHDEKVNFKSPKKDKQVCYNKQEILHQGFILFFIKFLKIQGFEMTVNFFFCSYAHICYMTV